MVGLCDVNTPNVEGFSASSRETLKAVLGGSRDGMTELLLVLAPEQQERAFTLGLAGLLGEGVFNFGELVSGRWAPTSQGPLCILRAEWLCPHSSCTLCWSR